MPNHARSFARRRAAPAAQELEAVRRSLDDLHSRLREQLGRLEETAAEDFAGGPGPSNRWEHAGYGDHLADDGTEMFERERALGQQQNFRDHLRQIEHALHKLDAGTYGVCDGCGRPINAERLLAVPEASLCIDCKMRLEQRAHVSGPPRVL